jgi:prepilin-type N-terminal cleavage/methylation domain-containing protein
MRRGFTLLELVVVIIIISILASVALGNYSKIVERSRQSEAYANLAQIRKLQVAFMQENNTYTTLTNLNSYYAAGLPPENTISSSYYFKYSCEPTTTKTCAATRCLSTESCKTPGYSSAYMVNVSLDNGTMSGGL